MESNYTKHIIETFEKSFSNSWIENMEWTSPAKKKQSFKQGLNSIEHFRENMVVQCSKMILSGDHLVNETNALDRLQVSIEEKVEDITYDKTLKSKLSSEYQSFLQDLLDIARLVKIHVNQTKKNFLPNEQVILGNFITYDRNRGNRHKMVTLMDWICESCAMEYCFSYDESYINDLLLLRQCVLDEKQKLAGDIYNVFTAVLGKIELLLCKLSAFSKGGKISYYHDLKLETIVLEDADKYKINDFRFLFKKYLNPSELDEQIVDIWQTESLNQNVAMWQLAFLMRYYTKCTKSIQQINNLLKLAEYHHEEYIKGNEKNLVNNCADRSFLNYMYNSRFSFLCQNQTGYSYEDMKRDLEKIEEVQAQTFIKNYHPYQTALDFTLKVIELKKSNSEKFEDISALVSDLNTYLEKYTENVKWCKKHQPYLMQLRFNFSSVTIEKCDFKTFCPSSFCRPLRFKELDEKLFSYQGKVAYLANVANNQLERKMLFDAKNKIDNMERKNMQQMGLFITITTFLIGLLSIFIGNNGEVSIVEKMNYVIALGLVLLIFVAVGYFAVIGIASKCKSWLFGILFVVALLSLLSIISSSSKKSDIVDKNNVHQFQQNNNRQSVIGNKIMDK